MLYWPEGSDDRRERVKFSNSDPAMIKLMMRRFRKRCKVPRKKFRIALPIPELHWREDIENYWSKIAGIPLNQFQKTQVKPTSLKYRRNPLYEGTGNIIICNTGLFRKIKDWKLGFLEKLSLNSNFNRICPRSSTERRAPPLICPHSLTDKVPAF